MKMLYNEYFHVPENGTVREKVLITRVALTVVVILLCLAAMSFTAYAHFSGSVSSAQNVIRSAHFDIVPEITPIDPSAQIALAAAEETEEQESSEAITFTRRSNGAYAAELKAGMYRVSLTAAGTAENGFAILKVPDTEIEDYHTEQLSSVAMCFTLQLNGDAVVEILPHWGTSSHYAAFQTSGDQDAYYITGEELVQLDVAGTGDFTLNTDDSGSDTGDGEESSEEEQQEESSAAESSQEESAQEESSAESSAEASAESSAEPETESSAESSVTESNEEASQEESAEASQEESSQTDSGSDG